MAEEKEVEEEEPSSSSNPPPKSKLWPEAEAISLLSAVLEISREPASDYDPRIDLYDRIRGKLAAKESLTDQQILAQIREIRASFEDSCRRNFDGEVVQKMESEVFVLSEKIWGDDMKLKLDQMKKPMPKPMLHEEEEMKKEKSKPNEEKKQKAEAAQSIKTSQDSEHHHERELNLESSKPTTGIAEKNPLKTFKRKLKQARDFTKKGTVGGLSNHMSGSLLHKGKKQKVECFRCKKVGHIARYCHGQMSVKPSTEEQDTQASTNDCAASKNKYEEQSRVISGSIRMSQDTEHHHGPEVKGLEAPKPTTCIAEKNTHKALKHKLIKQARKSSNIGADASLSMHKKGNLACKKKKQNVECFSCKKVGHMARDCRGQMTVKPNTVQQDTQARTNDCAGSTNNHEEQSSALISGSIRTLQETEHHHGPEVKGLEAPSPTACIAENTHEALKRKLIKQAQKSNNIGTDARLGMHEKDDLPYKEKKQNIECFRCRKVGHIARDCSVKMTVKPNIEQQDTASKNNHGEQSSALISVRSNPGSHEVTSKHIQPRVNVCSNFHPVHQHTLEQQKVVENFQSNSPSFSPLTSQQSRGDVSNSFQTPHQPRFQPNAYPFAPLISPQTNQSINVSNNFQLRPHQPEFKQGLMETVQPSAAPQHPPQQTNQRINVSQNFQHCSYRPTFEQRQVKSFQPSAPAHTPQHMNRPPLPPVFPHVPYRYPSPPIHYQHPPLFSKKYPSAPNYPMFNDSNSRNYL